MSMLHYLFEYSLLQKMEAQDLHRRRAERLRRQERRTSDERLTALEESLGEMALFVRTLYRLLVEKGTLDRAEFLEVARAIDAQDGAADGRYTGPLGAP
jgi:hypothetical protein